MICTLSSNLEASLDNIFIYFLSEFFKFWTRSTSAANITGRYCLGFKGIILLLQTAGLVLLPPYRAKKLLCMMLKKRNLFWCFFFECFMCRAVFVPSMMVIIPKIWVNNCVWVFTFQYFIEWSLILSTQYNRSRLCGSFKTRRGKTVGGYICFFRTKSNRESE